MEERESRAIPASRTTSPQQWVGNYADYLYNFAFSRLNSEEQARDLVQETFLAALERLHSFEGKSTERTWLTAILKNKIIDVYRKKASGLARITETQAEHEQIDFFDPGNGHWTMAQQPQNFGRSPEDPLLAKEFNTILKNCMEKLPSLWFSVFTMKHMDELTTELICAELKVTSANFWVIIHRTKLNLRACLQKNWT